MLKSLTLIACQASLAGFSSLACRNSMSSLACWRFYRHLIRLLNSQLSCMKLISFSFLQKSEFFLGSEENHRSHLSRQFFNK